MASPRSSPPEEHFDTGAPSTPNFDTQLAQRRPLAAFSLLMGGDIFESVGARLPSDGKRRAQTYTRTHLQIQAHGSSSAAVESVRADVTRLIEGNLELISRLEVARPIQVELVPAGHPLSRYGFPRSAHPQAVGLFWDDPSWPTARMALRQEKLTTIPQLAIHEMAHAIHFIALTAPERELVYRLLLPTYRSRAAVDEVFAIYSEREFVGAFTPEDLRAPGIYGLARQRWSEDHVFTRFIRQLYAPHKPLAGPKMAPPRF